MENYYLKMIGISNRWVKRITCDIEGEKTLSTKHGFDNNADSMHVKTNVYRISQDCSFFRNSC